MHYDHITLSIGLPRPVRLLHVSDSHLTFADERDDQRKRDLAAARTRAFQAEMHEMRDSLQLLLEAIDYAKENCDLLVHSGDLIDFVSHPNLEILKRCLAMTDTLFAPGNHEFSRYVGEAKEDDAYKALNFNNVQACVPNSIDFAARVLHGLNLVAVDDCYYDFKPRHLKLLQSEVARGLPIILLIHNPLYTNELYHETMKMHHQKCAYVVGTPENLVQCFSPERQEQQRPTKATLEFIEYAKSQPLVKAVLAGHLHVPFRTWLTPMLPQFVAGATYNGCASIIEIQ